MRSGNLSVGGEGKQRLYQQGTTEERDGAHDDPLFFFQECKKEKVAEAY